MNAWSDDLKSYLLLRLKANSFDTAKHIVFMIYSLMLQDIDQAFSKKYEHFLEFGKDSPERVSFIIDCGSQDSGVER